MRGGMLILPKPVEVLKRALYASCKLGCGELVGLHRVWNELFRL
jgi:hypothetical protein